MTQIALLRSLPLALAVLLAGPVSQADPPNAAPLDADLSDTQPLAEEDRAKVLQWIDQLSSDTYLSRERAMKNLQLVGRPAIPALAKAAEGDDLERATRSVRVLLELSNAKDDETSYKALNVVAELKNRPLERGAALSRLADLREERAIPEVLRLGGLIIPANQPQSEGTNILDSPYDVIYCLKVNDTWKGGNEGLRLVNKLRSLKELYLFSEAITDEGLADLRDLPNLSAVRIYGTNATAEGVAKLQARLPQLRSVEFRGGALLGVRATTLGEPAVIDSVTKNSAAEKAGLLSQDVILAFNGKPMPNFQLLREEIAKLNAGDQATIRIRRNGEEMTKQITFGRWK